jgi:hypothetical protein
MLVNQAMEGILTGMVMVLLASKIKQTFNGLFLWWVYFKK